MASQCQWNSSWAKIIVILLFWAPEMLGEDLVSEELADQVSEL